MSIREQINRAFKMLALRFGLIKPKPIILSSSSEEKEGPEIISPSRKNIVDTWENLSDLFSADPSELKRESTQNNIQLWKKAAERQVEKDLFQPRPISETKKAATKPNHRSVFSLCPSLFSSCNRGGNNTASQSAQHAAPKTMRMS